MKNSNWVLLFALGIIVAVAIKMVDKKKLEIRGDYICIDGCLVESLRFTEKFITIKGIMGISNVSSQYEIEGNYIYCMYGTFKIVDQNTILGEDLAFSGTYIKKGHLINYYQKLLGYYSVSASKLNVRSGPGTSYKSLGTLRFGETVEVINIDGSNWYKIRTKKKEGYVAKKYLKRK